MYYKRYLLNNSMYEYYVRNVIACVQQIHYVPHLDRTSATSFGRLNCTRYRQTHKRVHLEAHCRRRV